jgi:hypothetical protein
LDRDDISLVWEELSPCLDEKQRRILGATLSNAFGYGGITVVHQLTGLAMNTITVGNQDILENRNIYDGTIRKSGGGPKTLEYYHPEILDNVKTIVDASSYGDPEQPLSWTTMSHVKICEELKKNYDTIISSRSVGPILELLGYSSQTNRKMLQVGKPHPNRNAQFEFINSSISEFIAIGEPAISVDTKKKELVGLFKNDGSEYRKINDGREVYDHDFPFKDLGKVVPYGIYDIKGNSGYINLGISHDTPEFTVQSISNWWVNVGHNSYPNATKLLITCDCGGSNGYRLRLWKHELFKFTNMFELDIHVNHFHQGTSKWNKVEHRLFCYISKNWKGKPLENYQKILNLIASTTTKNNLTVTCSLDNHVYELGKKISDEEYNQINIIRVAPFEEWNYIIKSA